MTYGDKKWREWVLPQEEAYPFLKRAWDAGINFYDTANMYSIGVSETVLGTLFAKSCIRQFSGATILRQHNRTGNFFKDHNIPRDQVVIATKVFFPMGPGPNQKGLSRKAIFDAIDASLKRLQLDYVDLYQIHRWDYETPIEETMEALHDLVKMGKVRYIGASSMWTRQFIQAQHVAEMRGWTKFVSMQNHYNLIYREEEREMIPFCKETGVALLPWSPLARGFLAGSRGADRQGESIRAKTDDYATKLYTDESDFAVLDAVKALATKYDKSPAQIALAWMLNKPEITSPIIGASKMSHLEDALAALQIKLTPEDMKSLESPYKPHNVSGHA